MEAPAIKRPFNWATDAPFLSADRPPVFEEDITLGYTRIVRRAPNVPTVTVEIMEDSIEAARTRKRNYDFQASAYSMASTITGSICVGNLLLTGPPTLSVGLGLASMGFISTTTLAQRLSDAEQNIIDVQETAGSNGNHVFTELDHYGRIAGPNVPCEKIRQTGFMEVAGIAIKKMGARVRDF